MLVLYAAANVGKCAFFEAVEKKGGGGDLPDVDCDSPH
jgi:hypothetical protein